MVTWDFPITISLAAMVHLGVRKSWVVMRCTGKHVCVRVLVSACVGAWRCLCSNESILSLELPFSKMKK